MRHKFVELDVTTLGSFWLCLETDMQCCHADVRHRDGVLQLHYNLLQSHGAVNAHVIPIH